MFELISATGWEDARYKTKQMPRIPGEHGFWISTAYVQFLTHTSEMHLWHCSLCHDDKFPFQLAFFRDMINEISICLQLTRITFPWIQGKTEKTIQENIWMCAIHLSASAEKPSQRHPRWIPDLMRNDPGQKGKLVERRLWTVFK